MLSNMFQNKQVLIKRLINWAIVIIYMAVIFALSSQTGGESNKLSNEISQEVKEHVKITPSVKESGLAESVNLNFVMRKAAHFLEYFILGILIVRALLSCNIKLQKSLAIAFIICLSYAAADEIHQRFVGGRTPWAGDVLIDITGTAFALFIFIKIRKWRKMVFEK